MMYGTYGLLVLYVYINIGINNIYKKVYTGRFIVIPNDHHIYLGKLICISIKHIA